MNYINIADVEHEHHLISIYFEQSGCFARTFQVMVREGEGIDDEGDWLEPICNIEGIGSFNHALIMGKVYVDSMVKEKSRPIKMQSLIF